ncbi:MAG: TonB-dependent receptor [Dysgonamonadaceae bacterium]|jgi:TonB-linked SusC/RagA family outer membrane protein|nr:TonB-dependent receptor [Dysgonamonadaceae bacterium]
MKKLMLFLLMYCIGVYASAQITVSGVVTSSTDGSTMPGVSVTVKDAAQGTATGIDGNFSLSIPSERAVLVLTYIGYRKKEVPVTGSSKDLRISMEEDVLLLDEVVAVGYGTMKKSDLSGASFSLGEDKIRGSLITNIDQALQGRVSGVTSVMTSGAPGSSVSIRVRGQATLNAGAEPLYVVDGVIWQSGETNSLQLGLDLGNGKAGSISPLSTLNPSDIVSMEILKDASATAIYGAQGANGVVLVTTKRGKAGEARFTYEGMYGVQNQVRRLDMMNLREYATYSNAIQAQTAGAIEQPEYSDPSLLGAGTNWQNAIFQAAPMQQHTLSAQGGTETVQYYVSGSWMDQKGTIIGSDFQRFSVRANLDAQLKSWLKLGFNALYSNTNEHLTRAEGEQGVLTYSLQTPPDIPVYDVDGNYASQVREGYTIINPIAIAHLDENLLNRQKLNGNVFLEVTPFKNLAWHTELGYDIGNNRSENWKPTYHFGPAVQRPVNSLSWQRTNNFYWQVKNYVTYTGKTGKHNYTAMAGQEAWESEWEYQRIMATGLPGDEVRNPALGDNTQQAFANGLGDGSMVSFFTRSTYNYDDRYLATYTYRYDSSSNFGPKNRWAGFHSLAASWRFSNESFLEGANDVLSNGKLRAGWGQTGNSNINGGLWSPTLTQFPTGLGAGYKQSQIANPYVKWETQEQWNLGIDLGFVYNRINLSVDLYDKTAANMLMELQLPSYFGSMGNDNSKLTAPMGNFGTINNKGLEISLNTRNLTGTFKWDTDLQVSFNKNKLVALQGTDAAGIFGYGQWSDAISLSEIGSSLYEFYGYKVEGVYRSEAEIREHLWGENLGELRRNSTVFVGDYKYADLDGDGKITEYDRTSIGSPLPLFTYGLNNTFSYKGFDLSIFLQGSYGNKVFNALDRQFTGMGYWNNQLSKVMDYANIVVIDPSQTYPRTVTDGAGNSYGVANWYEDITNVQLSNPDTRISRAGRSLPYNNQRISDRYIEDGSYLRIKNIVLGYTLPRKWIAKANVSQARVYVNLQNLYTFTRYSGYDPEVGVNPQDASGFTFGFDQGRYPAPRVISGGVSISF